MGALTGSPATVPDVTLWYRQATAVYATLLCFGNVWLFFFLRGATGLPPLYGALLLFALIVPLLFSTLTWHGLLRSWTIPWCAVYLCVTVLGFFRSSESAVAFQELQTRVLFVLLFLAHLVILSDPRTQDGVRRLVLLLLPVTVVLNLYDLLNPGTFSLIRGRAAGLYLNPNTSAAALILGLLVALPALRRTVRPALAAVVVAGVFVTWSRGGLVGLMGVLLALAWWRLVPPRRLVVTGLISAGVVAAAVLSGGFGAVVRDLARQPGTALAWSRVLNAGDYVRGGDPSAGSRARVVGVALEMTREEPLLGHGLGATVEWSEIVSTHNIYVRHMAEHGLFGFLLYPTLLAAAVHGLRGNRRRYAMVTLGFLAFWGLVNHNVLDDWTLILPLALVAMMPREAEPQPIPPG